MTSRSSPLTGTVKLLHHLRGRTRCLTILGRHHDLPGPPRSPAASTCEQLQADLRRSPRRARGSASTTSSAARWRTGSPRPPPAGLTRVASPMSTTLRRGRRPTWSSRRCRPPGTVCPPQMPPEVRAHLDRLIPLAPGGRRRSTGPVAGRMPPGLHAAGGRRRARAGRRPAHPVDGRRRPGRHPLDAGRRGSAPPSGLGRLAAARAGDPPLTDVDFLPPTGTSSWAPGPCRACSTPPPGRTRCSGCRQVAALRRRAHRPRRPGARGARRAGRPPRRCPPTATPRR